MISQATMLCSRLACKEVETDTTKQERFYAQGAGRHAKSETLGHQNPCQSGAQDTLATDKVSRRTKPEIIENDQFAQGTQSQADNTQQEGRSREKAERQAQSELIEQESPEAEAELRRTLLETPGRLQYLY